MGGTLGLGTAPFDSFVSCTNFLLNYVVVVVHGCEPAEEGLSLSWLQLHSARKA